MLSPENHLWYISKPLKQVKINKENVGAEFVQRQIIYKLKLDDFGHVIS